LNKFKFEKFVKESVVFHHGELGDKYYLILKGACKVFIPKNVEEIEEEAKFRV